MGKHSASDSRLFWRTLALLTIKWMVLAVLPVSAGVGAWRLVQLRNQPPEESAGPAVAVPSPSPSPSLAAAISTETVEEPPPPSPSPSPAVIARVQVLNGTATARVGPETADRLESEGYEVVSVEQASRRYPQTTVFYQAGHRDAARTLAELLETNRVAPAPSNLDRSIPLTVVVGQDLADRTATRSEDA